MQVQGFTLTRIVTSEIVERWTTIPPRIELSDLRVDGASAGWQNDSYKIDAATWTVVDPVPTVPQIISDRQFFQQLAIMGVITQDEALAAVGPGDIPAALLTIINALPSDQQFRAKMLLKGAVQFDRQHPMVAVLGAAMSWTAAQIDALWIAAFQL